ARQDRLAAALDRLASLVLLRKLVRRPDGDDPPSIDRDRAILDDPPLRVDRHHGPTAQQEVDLAPLHHYPSRRQAGPSVTVSGAPFKSGAAPRTQHPRPRTPSRNVDGWAARRLR